jgi:hypothetical protein
MPVPENNNARVTGILHFNADDYQSLAMAARLAAVQAEKDAANQTNPGIVETFLRTARRYRELAEKCELARRVK